ncbi:MAG: MFS transporter [Nocardioidaceae bacterium]|nr:MFS transporter [Nocardioidaceae bacterium]MCL2615103.1 MFS transporter [Nocardioidaceae bacterium]
MSEVAGAGRHRLLLTVAAVAVAFAAIDTYVVVLALPDMMAGVGLSVEQLQRAAPIVSGFLLGYVAILPLIGRIADLRGPVPVLIGSLVVFSFGSLLTSVSVDLTSMVIGRFLQGVGGGGLVPATMAIVGLLYPADRRGLPLGVVSAVQEIGSVLGPLYGAIVLAMATWPAIFVINLLVGLVLAAIVRLVGLTGLETAADAAGRGGRAATVSRPRHFPDVIGALALAVMVVAGVLTFVQPDQVKRDLTWGQMFIPLLTGGSRWMTPVGATTIGAAVVLVMWCSLWRHPLVDLRGWVRSLVAADLRGAALLALALAGVVLAFATAYPQIAVFAPQGWWYLAGAVVAVVLLVLHLHTASTPVIPRGLLRARPAWGAVLVSFLVGFALIAALVDLPLFARTTIYPDSQLEAALVLLRFLVAVPIGAVLGGWLLRAFGAATIAFAGLACAGLGFASMTFWGPHTLGQWWATLPLLLGGLGFGAALAPVNAAMLGSTDRSNHGLASSLVVVARMVGMLVGISVLTTIGLRRLYAARNTHPHWSLDHLAILQEHSVFAGAAVAAGLAAVVALGVLRDAGTRSVDLGETLRSVG